LGNALYKRGNSEEAEKVTAPVKDSVDNDSVKSKLLHNLGNYSLDQKKYEEAIENYKNSLRINPNDFETKSNLAYAQKMLKEQQDQDNKDNKENKDNKDNKDNPEDKDDKQDQNKDDQQNQPPPNITPQAAQQMLQAIQNKDKETQEKVEKEKAKMLKRKQKEKNW